MIKSTTLVIASLIFAYLLAGCHKKADLEIWVTYSPQELKAFEKIVNNFENTYHVKVHIARIPWQGHLTKIIMSIIANSTPDLARVDPVYIPQLFEKSKLYKIDTSIIPKAAKSAILRYKGLPVAITDQVTALALFCREDLRNKLSLPVPQKWSDFLKLSNLYKKYNIYPLGIYNSLWWHMHFLFSFGIDKLTNIASKEGIECFKFLQNLEREDIEGKAWQTGGLPPERGFIEGRYLFIVTGSWQLAYFNSIKSEAKKVGKNFDFKVYPMPTGPAGRNTSIGGTCFVKLSNNKLADKFLAFLLTEQSQQIWYRSGQIPINSKVKTTYPIKVFQQLIAVSHPRPILKNYPKIEEEVNPLFEKILKLEVEVEPTMRKVEDIIRNLQK